MTRIVRGFIIGEERAPAARRRRAKPPSTAVVVISHNYGRFLAESLESVLQQTARPAEILVVDDSSTDETRAVAESYAARGVRYLRCEAGNVHEARKAGFLATAADVLVFLDADDRIPLDYLERGLGLFDDHRVSVVYSDRIRFGDRSGLKSAPDDYDRGHLFRSNYVHSAALVRRESLVMTRVFETRIDPAAIQDDWFVWQRIAAAGYHFAKSQSHLEYRQHNGQQSQKLTPGRIQRGYYHLAGLEHQDLTLYIPLSGRMWAWETQCAFLESQNWPHDQIRLVLCDTSQNPQFSKTVRNWIAETDYPDVQHFKLTVGQRDLADVDRRGAVDVQRNVNLAMTRIYNRLAQLVSTDYCWILEDDILPPLDVAARLLKSFDHDVASVSAVYRSRFHTGYVAWDRQVRPITHAGRGLQSVTGNGFGCVIMRAEFLRDNIFTYTLGRGHYDQEFYLRLPAEFRRLLDWSCDVEHLHQPKTELDVI